MSVQRRTLADVYGASIRKTCVIWRRPNGLKLGSRGSLQAPRVNHVVAGPAETGHGSAL